MLEQPPLLHHPLLLDFLEVPDSVRPMLLLAASQAHPHLQLGQQFSSSSLMPAREDRDRGKDAHKTFEERKVSDLLNLLRFHPNKSSALKAFELWFFDAKPRFNSDLVRQLFFGRPAQDGDIGFVSQLWLVCSSLVL